MTRSAITIALLVALLSCAQPDAAPSDGFRPTEEWVRAYYALFHEPSFDLDRLMAHYADDVRFTDPTFDIDVEGRAAVRELYAGIGTADSAYGAVRWSLDRIVIDEPNDVVIHGRWSGTFRGAPFDVQFVTLWRLDGDRIVAQTDFFDAPTFDAQVGWSSQQEPSPEADENQGPG